MMQILLQIDPSVTMNAAAPEGTPRGRSVTKNARKLPARRASRGPEAGILHIKNDFHDSGVN